MKITAGIDAGSRAIKIVLWDMEYKRVIASGTMDQGVNQDLLARQLYSQLLEENQIGPGSIVRVVSTGYGRAIVSKADETITEISCHARGVRHLHSDARTIVEIGGQDSKWLCLDEKGAVRDFSMNDRCAAGTGRFLEVVAHRLGIQLSDLGGLSAKSRKPAIVSSMCVVFAETEIIGLLASGVPPEDIVAGVQNSIATRVAAMAGRRVQEPVYFTGGVALIPGMKHAMESALNRPVREACDPQMTGALGAALLAAQKHENSSQEGGKKND